MKSAARLWLNVFGIGFTVVVILLLITLFTWPARGDMTRIGRISERAFGWHSTPPEIPDDQVRSVPLAEADVLVIGDSYSMFFAWQTSLVAAGYRVTSAHWDQIKPLCDDFGLWIRRSGFKGRLVIIESVERLLPERLAAAQQCKTMRKAFIDTPAPGVTPVNPAPSFALNWTAPLMTGVMTYHNTREIGRSEAIHWLEHDRFGDFIFSSPLPHGCAQFSNAMCDKGLFLAADRENRELTEQDAEFMHRFAKHAEPLQIMWMVIPNKTSVYLDLEHAHRFVERSSALALGPDLFTLARTQRTHIMDLYWPNDTHWSMQGQKYFGDQMLDAVRAAIGPAPRTATP